MCQPVVHPVPGLELVFRFAHCPPFSYPISLFQPPLNRRQRAGRMGNARNPLVLRSQPPHANCIVVACRDHEFASRCPGLPILWRLLAHSNVVRRGKISRRADARFVERVVNQQSLNQDRQGDAEAEVHRIRPRVRVAASLVSSVSCAEHSR